MQFHELQSKTVSKDKKRVGRGGKRGKTSGHGEKGQGARAGRKFRPAERELYMRLPKLRGVKNARKSPEAKAINVSVLQTLGVKEVTKKVLFEKKMIKSLRERVKILGTGELKIPVVIKGMDVSAEAKRKIEGAGGSIVA